VNGIGRYDLINGRPLSQVKELVHEILQDKLVVVCNGVKDFLCLGLDISEYQTFEIQKIFRKWNQSYTRTGEKVYQPVALKTLAQEYFSVNIQTEAHDAAIDAFYTLKLFKDVCIPFMVKKEMFSPYDEFTSTDFDEIFNKTQQ